MSIHCDTSGPAYRYGKHNIIAALVGVSSNTKHSYMGASLVPLWSKCRLHLGYKSLLLQAFQHQRFQFSLTLPTASPVQT